MENWKVYVHINKINKKAYFGITKQSLNRRFRPNGDGYKHCNYFYRAIQKYGWDNFQHILIKEKLQEKEAIFWEKWLIKRYKTQDHNFGYNISSGGDVVIDSQLISQKNKQRWKQGIYNKIKNKVYCVELKQEFESALQAEKILKIDNSAIQKACKGIHHYAGIKEGQALHWLFVDDITKEKIQQLYKKEEILKGVSIPVYCIELQKEFPSARQASKKLLIDESSIRKAVRQKVKSAGKDKNGNPLHWIGLQNKINVGNFNQYK